MNGASISNTNDILTDGVKRMAVTIHNAKAVTKNTLRGFFDVELPSGLKINGCTLHAKDGKSWVGLPAREWQKPDGSKSWTPMVEINDREARDKFNAAVLPFAAKALGVPL
jgi:hypothetical protein